MASHWLLTFGRWLFKYRNRVFPLVLLALFVSFRPPLITGSARGDLWFDLVGFGIAIAGQCLRTLVVGFAYIKRGGLNKQVHADALVTTGLFAHSRNPLYLGNVMILSGLFIIHGHPLVYVLGGLFFGIGYLAIISTEEAYLAHKFGDQYSDYCARVNRWWVRWQGLDATLAGMEFKWRRVLAKEFASALTWWLTAFALLAYEAAVNGGLTAPRAECLLVATVVSIGLFLWAQRAKHAGRLVEPAA